MKKRRERKKIKKSVVAVLLILIILFAYGFRYDLKTVRYTVDAEQVTGTPIRLAVIGDLHSCLFGEGQSKLIKAIDKESPDAIVFTGDIFDNVIPDDNTETLFKNLKGKYPCYYVTGNHECWSGNKGFAKKMDILKENGATRLSGESVIFQKDDSKIYICGVDDKDIYKVDDNPLSFVQQLDKVQSEIDGKIYSVLLAHRPEQIEVYKEYNFGLVLSGHAHGGQWRIPFILNGLYTPFEGLFPDHAGGEYKEDGTHMIVTRGLATNETIPRYYNRTELVIVDIT